MEAIASDFEEGKMTNDEIIEEQRNQDGDDVLASVVGWVCHNVTLPCHPTHVFSHIQALQHMQTHLIEPPMHGGLL